MTSLRALALAATAALLACIVGVLAGSSGFGLASPDIMTSIRVPRVLAGFGVSTIQPERGRSFEAGASWQGEAATLSATIYRNDVRDLIVFEPDRSFCPPDPAYNFGCAANRQRARLQGATLAATARWQKIDLRANVDFLDATDRDTGVRLPRRAAHQESAGAEYVAGAWRFGASGLFVGSRPDNGIVLGGYAVFDLRVAWQPRNDWQFEARLANALDRTIEPVRDYRGLGRQAWIGVRYASTGL